MPHSPKLPSRLFALDQYPVWTKINSYSKPEYLTAVVDALEGDDLKDWFYGSVFGKIMSVPPSKSSFSAKLILGFLCHQVTTAKRHEIWMVFGSNPIRFSLREPAPHPLNLVLVRKASDTLKRALKCKTT